MLRLLIIYNLSRAFIKIILNASEQQFLFIMPATLLP